MSKAALRSKRNQDVEGSSFSKGEEDNFEECSLSTVLYCGGGRKPDWRRLYKLCISRSVCNWEATVHSRVLARKGKLEMWWKLLRMVMSSPVFFKMGLTAADL